MTLPFLLQKILRRIKNTFKYFHGRIISLTYKKKTYTFSPESVLQFKRPAEKDVWIEIPTLSDEEIIQILSGKISIFGHTTQILHESACWHHDLRIPPEKNPRIGSTFSFDIAVKESSDPNPLRQSFDIKYPWERSRFQHLLSLGKTFKENPTRSDLFIFFSNEIESWIHNNPYLYGPCWMNAMEVAIRSTNLIWLLSFFYTEQTAKTYPVFWNKYLSNLLEHANFIANYWEDYDHPNNHYLLNLTGSWYLARFFALHSLFPFGDLAGLWEKVCTGFNKQLNNDGTHYENSTAYHGLVIQSLQHLAQLNTLSQHTLPTELAKKLAQGTQFFADSFISGTNIQIKIGDDDSGSLVWTITAALIPDIYQAKKQAKIPTVRHYPDFGITFICNTVWHVSLRTKSFEKENPTGHSHADLLGITIAYKQKPIITDPGTGCYTANTTTRNKLRSWEAHSTLFQPNNQRFDFSNLFSVKGDRIPTIPPIFSGAPHAPTITAQYSNEQILFTRSIKVDSELDAVIITDSANSVIKETNFPLITTFTLDPEIEPILLRPTHCQVIGQTTSLFVNCKKTAFATQETVFSDRYGVITSTKQIVAEGETPYHDCIEVRAKTQTPEI